MTMQFESDRNNDWISWLTEERWQWLITLTFPSPVEARSAYSEIRELIQRLQAEHQVAVQYFVVQALKAETELYTVFHLLMYSRTALLKTTIRRAWSSAMATPSSESQSNRSSTLTVKPFVRDDDLRCFLELVKDQSTFYFAFAEYWSVLIDDRPHETRRKMRRPSAEGMIISVRQPATLALTDNEVAEKLDKEKPVVPGSFEDIYGPRRKA